MKTAALVLSLAIYGLCLGAAPGFTLVTTFYGLMIFIALTKDKTT